MYVYTTFYMYKYYIYMLYMYMYMYMYVYTYSPGIVESSGASVLHRNVSGGQLINS